MTDFHHLKVWQKAHELTLAIYRMTLQFPQDERYGLSSQLRRGAASIPANLAEGCGRDSDGELARFCGIAMGSATEVEYHLLLARDLDLMPADEYSVLSERTIEIKRMLTGFIHKLRAL